MNKRIKAEEKFYEAVEMMCRTGMDPLHFMLSFVSGYMDGKQCDEYAHNFEHRKMTITLSGHDDKPKLTLIKGGDDGESNVPA